MYTFDMKVVVDYFPLIFQGIGVTIKFSLLSIILGTIIGIIAALCKLSRIKPLAYVSSLYIEWVRGTPLLIQLFFMYFGLGLFLNISASVAGIVALTLFAGAYVAEIVRSGIQSIDKGQTEAAHSLGMSSYQTMLYIIFPQAFKRVLPPLAGQFASLVKDSSLLSVIAIGDITFISRQIVSTTFRAFEIFFTVSIIYFIINLTMSLFVGALERRLSSID